MKQGIKQFFKYARDRHQIYLNRAAGMPREKWTKDPILQTYRFTNVFRELDKTTVWFRKNVRDPLRDKPEVLLATVLFRLLNRIEVGEAIFLQRDMISKETAFEEWIHTGKIGGVKSAIKTFCGKGPYVTGAYIITSPQGYDKLTGIMRIIDTFDRGKKPWIEQWSHNSKMDCGWEDAALLCKDSRGRLDGSVSLEHMWEWLKRFDYFGPFHSYEMVTDLRHTALLEQAPDIMTWANPGPGCRRGLNRIHGRDKDAATSRMQLIEELQELVCLANTDTDCWPKDWPKWEMREAEHTACESDKYTRVRLGEGRPRGVYR